jgi:DNA-binding XRE family transcriptional regulator
MSLVKYKEVSPSLGYGFGMGETGNSGPKPTIARFALASNLKTLMDTYADGFSRGISSRQLAGKAGVSYKTVDRILNPYSDVAPNLDSIDSIAAFFRVQTWELLVPRSRAPLIAGQERATPEATLNSAIRTAQKKKTQR